MSARRCRSWIGPFLCSLAALFAQGSAFAQKAQPMPVTLAQATDLALKQNRDIKLAHLAVDDSKHKKEIARSDYYPHINNQSSVLHITALAGVEVPRGAFGDHPSTGPIPGQNLFLDQGALTSYTSGTGLQQPITQMFKIHEANRAATADINTARIQIHQAEDDIVLKVRQLYFDILIAQLKQQAAEDESAADQIKLKESTEDVERGRALDVAVLQSRASYLNARQTALTEKLQVHDLTIELDDLLGLPLSTELLLDSDTSSASLPVPSREECQTIALEHSPDITAARQTVIKAKAGLAAAKDAYIPDITGLARYSYQSGIPLLVHNFGTFGFTFSYDLFDGGKRDAQIRDSRTLLEEAELNLKKIEDDVAVKVEQAYDKIEQLRDLVGVSQEVLDTRTEAARVADSQFERNAALESARAEAHAGVLSAKASTLEATLGLALAQADLKRLTGEIPR